MPPDAQVGLITIRANYEGNPNYLLGTAPIYSIAPRPEEAARFSFVVPILDIPISIPVAVRTAADYGLRFTVTDITQLTPLASARLTFWGFPAAPSHDARTLPQRLTRPARRAAPARRRHRLQRRTRRRQHRPGAR